MNPTTSGSFSYIAYTASSDYIHSITIWYASYIHQWCEPRCVKVSVVAAVFTCNAVTVMATDSWTEGGAGCWGRATSAWKFGSGGMAHT